MEVIPSPPAEKDTSNQSRPGSIEAAQRDTSLSQHDEHNETGVDGDEHFPPPNDEAPMPQLSSVTDDVRPALHLRSPSPMPHKNETSPQDEDRREADENYASRKEDEKAKADTPVSDSLSSASESDSSSSSARVKLRYREEDLRDREEDLRDREEELRDQLKRIRNIRLSSGSRQVPNPATSTPKPRVIEAKYHDPYEPYALDPYDPYDPYTSYGVDYRDPRQPSAPKAYGVGSRTKSARRPPPPPGHTSAYNVYDPRRNSDGILLHRHNPQRGNDAVTNASTSKPQQPRPYHPPITEARSRRMILPDRSQRQPRQHKYAKYPEELFEDDSLYSESDAVEEEQIPYTLKAELNYVGWQQFKHIRENPRGESYVIDVLTEEPDVAFTEKNVDNPLFLKMMTIGRYSAQAPAPKVDPAAARGENKPSVPKQFAPGQGPLPERVRINSQRIISILSKIIGGPAFRPEPLVIVRPFKALVHHENELQAWAQRLAEKYPDEISDPGSDKKESKEQGLPEDCTTASGTDPDGGRPIADVPIEENAGDKDVDWDEIPDENLRAKLKAGLSQGDKAQGAMESDPTDSRIALQHLRCLLEFIDQEIHAKIQHIENSRSQKVYFSDIWYLFKPGDEVLEQAGRQAYRVINVQSMGHMVVPPWASWGDRANMRSREKMTITLTCVCIDFDGFSLGPVQEIFTISRFDGQRPITSLPVYPLRFYAKQDARDTLIARGKMFPELVSIKHASYSGLTLDTRDDVDGQVVIDFEEAVVVKREWKPSVENFVGLTTDDRNSKESCTAECCSSEVVFDDFYVERNRHDDFMASLIPQRRDQLPSLVIFPRPISEIKNSDNHITDSEFLIMSHRVFGFVLHSRKWAQLDLTYLTYPGAPGTEDDTRQHGKGDNSKESSFDQLVLPSGHKELVQSLISQHFRDKMSADGDKDQHDIVRGKGKGLILLLHGAPGVGKTTTAECVASYFRKPLFHITCGDLGIWAKDVEITLETNFALANRWGCILLLDEADVFLASRTPTDHMRNSMVSVFLRVLEYYAGILFLTTNRVGDFDEAFASRVHMSLYYPPLDLDSTQQIFGLNLERIRGRFSRKGRMIDIKQFEIGGFVTNYWQTHAKARWNGRQIRNACQTALALAEFEAQKGNDDVVNDPNATVYLQVKHFQTVADAYLGFMVYMKDIYGVDADERAKEKFLRAGTTGEAQPNPLTTRRQPNSSMNPFPRSNPGRTGPSIGATQTHQQYAHAQPAAPPGSGFPVPAYAHRQAQEYLHNSPQSPHHVQAGSGPRQTFQNPSQGWPVAEGVPPHDISLQMPGAEANTAQYSAQLSPPPSSMHPYGAYQGQGQPAISSPAHITTPLSGQSAQGWMQNDQDHPFREK